MISISISVEGLTGLNWSRWKRLVTEIERLGFAGLFCSDHFVFPEPPDVDSLELVVALTYLADHTQRVHFGSLVSPLSFRDLRILARQAAALDNLSGGRMILGVGTGWMEREHIMFGYELGDVTTRVARLEEGLAVLSGLLYQDAPLNYEGRFYKLREAVLLPRPHRPNGPPIMIGGNGPTRTLPLVARYAHIWNGVDLKPDEFRERSTLLDQLLLQAGRQPEEIKCTLALPLFCGRDPAELEQRVSGLRHIFPAWADLPLDTLLENFRVNYFNNTIVGTPDQVVQQIRAYDEVGVEELMIQWVCLDDIAGLQGLADQVLPHFAE